ncbi:NADP-dependent oxidoreductase domain-containing protein [Schizophyllum amplum]|uniref:NADP-dependent oxidoreductase domain-containing protein n=1 Tax=Schizophyllum amplum TaxID=97359 RepID=A0A550CWM4_9AGAR|nr:NADP-dependent oxidoreductase domain-containing protein [Auriculariopsis ampla]
MASSSVPNLKLNNGTEIPAVGMGCWMGGFGEEQRAYDMCSKALKCGYRHFDTASGYGNEEAVGRALRESGIPRNELYVTTKLPNAGHHRVRECFDESLKALDLDYIDLYLIHWPQGERPSGDVRRTGGNFGGTSYVAPDEAPTIVDVWKEMEKLLETGKVRTIGVSNFSVKTLSRLLPHCTVVPAVNQVEMHPCLPQEELKTFCAEKGIVLTGYSPLGRSKTLLEYPAVNEIAEKAGASPAQVLLSWAVQRGTTVVPKSEDEGRMAANLKLIPLSPSDMQAIDAIHKQPGMHKSLLKYHNADGTVMGWTYEQLGWNFGVGGVVKE